MKDAQPFSIIHHDDYETKMILLQQLISDLTPDQNHIFSEITTHIMDPSRGQLVGLVSGEGGTGKTQVMKVIKMWCDSIYGKVQGEVGCCAIGAPTGPAAFNVGGNTWQV
jgi:RecG-like helicase